MTVTEMASMIWVRVGRPRRHLEASLPPSPGEVQHGTTTISAMDLVITAGHARLESRTNHLRKMLEVGLVERMGQVRGSFTTSTCSPRSVADASSAVPGQDRQRRRRRGRCEA